MTSLMTRLRNRRCKPLVLAGLLSVLSIGYSQSHADLRPGHPDRYVVKEGDTLWELANRFLNTPWRWPLIWQNNEQIENPHLIYPGDLLVVTGENRIKAIRLKPKVRKQSLASAIPTIPPHVIQPFLTSAAIIGPGELDRAGYVLVGAEDEIVMGKYSQFYARNLADSSAEEYRLFRIGRSLSHPESGELLGIESIHLGDSKMLRRSDDVSKLQIISSNQGIRAKDRLLPITESSPLPYFQPHSPPDDISGWILYAPRGVREIGRYDTVIISAGSREGLTEGHVLKAIYHRGTRKDPITGENFDVPDEASGLMMVFRVFEKLSYALIMESRRAISVGDKFSAP